MDSTTRAQSILADLCTNVFSIEGITKVHWREYKGTIPVISVCVEELSQAEQACFACLGELATPLSAKYHQQHDEGDKKSANARPATAPKSPSKLEDDLLHLYVFSWTAHGQSVQNSILQTYVATGEAEESPPPSSSRPKGIELLSSGDWQTNGGYSINEAPRRSSGTGSSLLRAPFVSSAGPTVPHPGRTAAHQTPLFVSHASSALATTQSKLRHNLTKLLFKSLEELFHRRLMRESFIRVGEYYILVPSDEDPAEVGGLKNTGGAVGLKFKFFVSGAEEPNLCFYNKLVRTILHPLPPVTSPWCAYHANNGQNGPPILVVTAPCGVGGYLAEPSELARPKTSLDPRTALERDHTLSQWRKMHHIVSTSTISVNIAGIVYPFPRSAVFLLSPPVSPSAPPLARQTLPIPNTAPRVTPLQLFHELYSQEFGSATSATLQQPSFVDQLENWTPTHTSTLIESINAQATQLCTYTAPSNPKKRQRAQMQAVQPEEDEPDFDRALTFDAPLSSGLPIALTPAPGMTAQVSNAMDVTEATESPTMDDEMMEEVGEFNLGEEDIFDDRGVTDVAFHDWGFGMNQSPKNGDKVSVEARLAEGTVGSAPSSDAYAPSALPFSPPYADPFGGTHYATSTPAVGRPESVLGSYIGEISPTAPEPVPTLAPSRAPEMPIPQHAVLPLEELLSPTSKSEEAPEEEEPLEDTRSDVSSHLSLSDEEDLLATRVWNHSMATHSTVTYSDVCPPVYRPINAGRNLVDFPNAAYAPLGSPKSAYPTSASSYAYSLHNSQQVQDIPVSEHRRSNSASPLSIPMDVDDFDSDASDEDDDSETTMAESIHSMATSTRTKGANHHQPLLSYNYIANSLFDTYLEEPSALFSGNSANFASFSPRSFALTAWTRLAAFANGDSAILCFVSRLCNFFETTTGALISNYLPLLYNAEVFFKVSTSPQISQLAMPSALSSASNPLGLPHGIGGAGGTHHSHHNQGISRNEAMPPANANTDPLLIEVLDRETFNINSPIQGFADTTWRLQSDLCVDVFRMYFRLDQTRLALWHMASGGSVPSTPHTAMPSMTPSVMLTADDIFSAEWSSISGTHIGPLSAEDWLMGRNLGTESSGRKSLFTSKWSGSFEAQSGAGASFSWPLEHSMKNTQCMWIMSQLASEVFGENFLGEGTRVSGPVALNAYQRLLSGAVANESQASQVNQASQGTDVGKTQYEVEVLKDPVAIVRYGEEGSMELPVTALYAWEKLNLRPLSPAKDVTYYVLSPANIMQNAMVFFRQLSAVYSQCNLGSHSIDPHLAATNGVIACHIPSGLDEFNRRMCFGGICEVHPQTASTSSSSSSSNHGDSMFSPNPLGSAPATPMPSSSNPATTGTNQSLHQSSGMKDFNTSDPPRFVWGATASSTINPNYPTASPYVITEEQLKGYEEWASKLAERLSTTSQYNKSIVVYVVSPFTLESSVPTFAGDAKSALNADTPGTTRQQQILAQRSSVLLLRAVFGALRKSNVRNLVIHGISQNRVAAPTIHSTQLKEEAFNVYTKCRRVLLGEASRDQREPAKLYEPLFVLGKPSPSSADLGAGHVPMALLTRREETDFTLHVAYVLTSRSLTWSICDTFGEIIECSTLPTHSSITLALFKLLEKVAQTLVDVGHKWKLVIGKLGYMSPGELVEWNSAIKDHFVTKANCQLVEQVSLVAFYPSTFLDVLPSSVFPIVPEPSLTASTNGPAQVMSDQRYSVSVYGNLDQHTSNATPAFEAPKTIAIYDSKPDPDAWDNDLLAQSHTFTFNPQWHHASLWGNDMGTPNTVSLCHLFQFSTAGAVQTKTAPHVESISDPVVVHSVIRHITRHYHQLSWLNRSPVSIGRVDTLPIHFRLVRKLSNLHHAQNQP